MFTEELLGQLKLLNYSLNNLITPAREYFLSNSLSEDLLRINSSLESLNLSFETYQHSITSQSWFSFVIGSLSTLAATWLYEFLKERKKTRDYLFNIQRLIVDQVNMILEIEETINKFVDKKLNVLIERIKTGPSHIYSVETAFFPLFSARSLPEIVNDMSSGSNYLDNKVGKIYSLSKDLPFIIEDLRKQFEATFERNEKIAYAKLNPAPAQREQFAENLEEFRRVLVEDMLKKNIPLYLNKFVEALVVVREKTIRYPLTWKVIHDPRFKFFWTSKSYALSKTNILEQMDKYFEAACKKQLEEIERLKNSN